MNNENPVRRAIGVALILMLLIGCSSPITSPTVVPVPSHTPTATATPVPTATASPTATSTPAPTPTPVLIHVQADGSGDYATLEEAVQDAPSGASIFLGAGIYTLEESLLIQKSVRLVGAGMDETDIVSQAEGFVVGFDSPGGSFGAEGITFRHEGSAAASVAVVWQGEVQVSRCRLTGGVYGELGEFAAWPTWMGAGLALDLGATGVVQDCEATGNFAGVTAAAQEVTLEANSLTANSIGLLYIGTAGGVARDNECSRNLRGISVFHEARPTLEENVCTDNLETGILYLGDASGSARRNECSRNGLAGISVEDRARPTLVENTCADNDFNGIYYGGNAAGVARGNECSGNATNGIDLGGEARPTLESNTCTGNHTGILVADQAQPTLDQNICTGNEVNGIGYIGKSEGAARGNDCSGNGANGIRVGEQAQPTLEDNTCTGNELAGIAFVDNAAGVARQNVCSENATGIWVDDLARPTLHENVCTDNFIGIGYWPTAGGVAAHNECSGNSVGIYVSGDGESAGPELDGNNCYDNTEADIEDERQ